MDSTHLHSGFYRGIVQDNADPQKQRRLRLLVPQTTGTGKDSVTDWAWPVEPSSIHTGVPAVGQGVWVSFVGGDPDYPIWHGAFGTHQDKSKPLLVTPLSNSVSLSGLTNYLVTVTKQDGTAEVDLMATLLAMAKTIADYQSRITSLESQVASFHSNLGSRTLSGHTHTTNG